MPKLDEDLDLLQSDEDTEAEQSDFAKLFEESDFAQMVDQTLDGIKEGEVVQGRVVEISPVGVVVDIGYKAEGEIPIEEFMDERGRLTVSEGDKVKVLIEAWHTNGEEEELILSHRRAGEAAAWEAIEEAYKDNGTVSGTIVSRVKGGLRVDVGVAAFLPGSQVDLRPVRDMDAVLGQTFDFRVLKFSRQRRNVVLSRRVILEEQREKEKTKLMTTLAEDQVLKGVVKNVVKYGAFIDLGGMDGLLHVSDMSWGRINHPGDLVSVGDELDVKVLKFDREKQRISLGLKQLTPDPWLTAVERYPVGALVSGKVVNVVDYGAFIEIEPGLEGLIHVTEMSWSGAVRQASQVVNEGEEVEAAVINIDPEERKLALSIKQTMPDPWGDVAENFPEGTVLEGKIKTVTDFGLFVGLEAGVDGLIHKKDLTWSGVAPNPEELYEAGQDIQAMVLAVDLEKKRVALGVKQLTENPWLAKEDEISIGGVLTGQVIAENEDGLVISIAEGLEGLAVVDGEGNEPETAAQIGDEIEVRVLEFQPERGRLELAIIPPSSIKSE